MTKREQLQEQYEDALFAIMMAELAESEGAKAWKENERLKQDPNAAVPLEVQERCLRTIRQQFKKQRHRVVRRIAFRTVGKIAIIIGILSMLFIGAMATSETFRESFLNLFLEVSETNSKLYILTDEDEINQGQLLANWVPDGYILQEQTSGIASKWISYYKSEAESFRIVYSLSDGGIYNFDTEDASIKDIEINSLSAIMTTKGSETQIIWTTENKDAFIRFTSYGLTEEEAILIACALEY